MSDVRAASRRDNDERFRRIGLIILSAVASRPWLWPVGVAEAVRLARRGWWRRWPPLPIPSPELWRFRMETAYGGDGDAEPDPRDVRSFLRWCTSAGEWR